MNNKAVIVGMFFIFSLQACSSSGSSDGDSPSDNVDQISSAPGSVLSESAISIPANLTAAANGYQFDYAMTGVTGELTTARAQLFEPSSAAPADGHPLVVWAHGTTGIANACQPSANFNTFTNAGAINDLLSAGYAVLAPDYEGFGTDSIHPYYVRSSHANSITDSIPAAHNVEGVNISDDWAIVGHSQGGHVALATARAEALPAYPLQAVAALAPGTDLKAISDAVFDAIDQNVAEGNLNEAAQRLFYLNVYGAFIAHGVREVEPDFDPRSIFGDTMDPLVETAATETECNVYAALVQATLDSHFDDGGTVFEFSGVMREWYKEPTIDARLEAEALSDEAQAAPLLIVQGDADLQIPIAAINAFVDQQRSIGTDVTYEVVAGGRHVDVSRGEFYRTINWLTERFPVQ